MEILCHRGLWSNYSEQNSIASISGAFRNGFGVEFDVRDQGSCLVISHDIPKNNSLELKDVFNMYNDEMAHDKFMAINIKSDGIVDEISRLINEYKIINYFVFDMSVPQLLEYHKKNVKLFSRVSEYEDPKLLLAQSVGVWVDAFHSDWISEIDIRNFVSMNKMVCLVSPELHGRQHSREWNKIKSFDNYNEIMLCTDHPLEAKEFFVAGH